MDINNRQYYGNLRISVVTSGELRPIAGALVTIAYTEEPSQAIFEGITDISGETEEIQLTAPNFGFSQKPSETDSCTRTHSTALQTEGREHFAL